MERVSGGIWNRVTGFLRYLMGWSIAMLVGTFGAFPVLTMGLVVPESVVWPLSMGTGAVLAAVGTLWAGTLLERGCTHGRPIPILCVCLSTAAVISIAYPAVQLLGGYSIEVSAGVTLLIGIAVIALNASVATWRFRAAGRNLQRDALLTVVLLVLIPVVVSTTIYATCTLGICTG